MNTTFNFKGDFLILGFGSVASSLLPILINEGISKEKITILTADENNSDVVNFYNVKRFIEPLHKENYKQVLNKHLKEGDFLINLSVDVDSLDLIEYCQEKNALYLDTCIEPWPGYYKNENSSLVERSNWQLRQRFLQVKAKQKPNSPTAVIANGANPGLVTAIRAQGMINLAKHLNVEVEEPKTQEEWAALAYKLNIKTIHIAEHDTQVSNIAKKQNESINTWSWNGLTSEGTQPAEIGLGSHETYRPKHSVVTPDNQVMLFNSPGMKTKVRTWTPVNKEAEGFIITHNEAISEADFLTHREGGKVVYRPTVHYAYRPCNDAIVSIQEVCDNTYKDVKTPRILREEITEGIDELGVLLMGHAKHSYWIGSVLSIEEARKLAKFNSATSLQIVAGVFSGIMWAINHPTSGMVESHEMDYKEILKVAKPFLGNNGTLVEAFSDFTPLKHRSKLFKEEVDEANVWSIQNFLV